MLSDADDDSKKRFSICHLTFIFIIFKLARLQGSSMPDFSSSEEGLGVRNDKWWIQLEEQQKLYLSLGKLIRPSQRKAIQPVGLADSSRWSQRSVDHRILAWSDGIEDNAK
jgi:hypothetical protein